eukprot:378543-Rhodomonas_salina.4
MLCQYRTWRRRCVGGLAPEQALWQLLLWPHRRPPPRLVPAYAASVRAWRSTRVAGHPVVVKLLPRGGALYG